MAHYLLLFSLSPTSNNELHTSLGRMKGSARNLAHASLETAVEEFVQHSISIPATLHERHQIGTPEYQLFRPDCILQHIAVG